MILQAIEADATEVESLISDWHFEMMTASWPGYWILQLTKTGGSPLGR